MKPKEEIIEQIGHRIEFGSEALCSEIGKDNYKKRRRDETVLKTGTVDFLFSEIQGTKEK